MADLRDDFTALLGGSNYRVLQEQHPWLNLYLQNLNGRTALILREKLPDPFMIQDGKGFSVSMETVRGVSNLTVASREPGLNDLFMRLVGYVLQRTKSANSKESSLRAFEMAIKEFVAFSGKNPGRLSLQRTRGLFAELLFIHRLLGSGKTSPAVLKAWKGPHLQEGVGMHDFVFAEGDSYEVKATSHPSTEIRVSSVLQLVPGNHSLHLVVVPLETLEHDSRYGQTISQLALSCLELFEKSGLHYVAEFMDALLGIGFDLTDGYYGQWKFATEPWRHFEVRQGFPVLDLRGVPSAITKIRYSLELALLVDFEIRNPAIFSPGGDSGHSRTAERD